MNSSRIFVLGIVIIVALIGSLFLGEAVAQENYTTVGIFFSLVTAIAVIKILGVNIWVLIPVFISFGAQSPLLPLPLSVANIMSLFVLGVVAIQYMLGMVQLRWRMSKMEFFMLLVLLSMFVTYALNPVGLNVLGSSTVGSRPYLEVMLALAVYALLSGIQAKERAVKSLPFYVLVVNGVSSVLAGISYHFPSIGERLKILYGGFAPHYDESSKYGFQMAERFTYLGSISQIFQRYLMVRKDAWSPRITRIGVTVIGLGLALVAGMLTGHRIALMTWVGFLIIYMLITRKLKMLFMCIIFGILGFIGLYVVHHAIMPLPLSIQRSMTILPGDWDRDVVHDAEGSLDWRLEMWDAVLHEKGRVRNKIMGDGFGFSARELELMQQVSMGKGVHGLTPEELQEYFLVSGDLHSGPLTAVRFVGWVGLFFFTLLMLYLARSYWKLCRRSLGTPYFMVVAFMGIPWIWFPIKYIFLYGDYAHNIPGFIVGAGLYKLLEKVVSDYYINSNLNQNTIPS